MPTRGDLNSTLISLKSAIEENDFERCHDLTMAFKQDFSEHLTQPGITSEQQELLANCLTTFDNLVQLLQDKKKEAADALTEYKRNSAKISKYTQLK